MASAPPIAKLPFDIIHLLLDFAPIVDLVNLCSTCKALRLHLSNDSIWKRASAPHGIRDFAHFGRASPYVVYTQLLHPYAALVGLWASDHPFRGNVLEFRLTAGDEHELGGIIGELWSFQAPEPSAQEEPLPPTYVRAVKIGFDAVSVYEGDTEDEDGPPKRPYRPHVRVMCDGGPSAKALRHPASLIVRPDSCSRHRIQFYRQTIDLPEFPMLNSPWYDDSPRHLRLPLAAKEPQLDQSGIINIYPAARLPAIWVSPSVTPKPSALSFLCSRAPEKCACAALHVPSIPFANLDERPPRYYPLKRTILPGVDPRSSAWTLQSMEGLWYGSYGPHGTEFLYLAWMDAHEGQLVATKITGDVNVPRGWVSWILCSVDEESDSALVVRQYWNEIYPQVQDGGEPPVPMRVLCGRGIVAARGFK